MHSPRGRTSSPAVNAVPSVRKRPSTGLRPSPSAPVHARQLWSKINKVIKAPYRYTVLSFLIQSMIWRSTCTSRVRSTRFVSVLHQPVHIYQGPPVASAVYSVVVPASDSQRGLQAHTTRTVQALSSRPTTDVVGQACY